MSKARPIKDRNLKLARILIERVISRLTHRPHRVELRRVQRSLWRLADKLEALGETDI